MAVLWSCGALLLVCLYTAGAEKDVVADPTVVSNATSAVLTCNYTGSSAVQSHHWTRNGKTIEGTKKTSADVSMQHKLDKIDSNSGGVYACVFTTTGGEVKKNITVKTKPHVGAYKHSEHGNEGDKGALVCVSHGYPMPTDWAWFKLGEGGEKAIENGTEKYEIKSTPEKTTLYIHNLDIEQDKGDYGCRGTNELGANSDQIHLRVRSRLAALWPFLGIVAEVVILIAIIFIYEKRRKPDEVNDDACWTGVVFELRRSRLGWCVLLLCFRSLRDGRLFHWGPEAAAGPGLRGAGRTSPAKGLRAGGARVAPPCWWSGGYCALTGSAPVGSPSVHAALHPRLALAHDGVGFSRLPRLSVGRCGGGGGGGWLCMKRAFLVLVPVLWSREVRGLCLSAFLGCGTPPTSPSPWKPRLNSVHGFPVWPWRNNRIRLVYTCVLLYLCPVTPLSCHTCALLYLCPVTPLSCCTCALLPLCPVTPVSCYPFVLLHLCPVVRVSCYPFVLLYLCPVTPLSCCTCVLSYLCPVVPVSCYSCALSYLCPVALFSVLITAQQLNSGSCNPATTGRIPRRPDQER